MKRSFPVIVALLMVGVVLPFTPALGRWIHSMVWSKSFGLALSRLPFWICVAFLAFLIFRLLLSILASRGIRHAVLLEIYEQGFIGTVWRVYRRRVLGEIRLGLLLVAWAFGIMGTIALLFSAGFMDGGELQVLRREMVSSDRDTMPATRTFFYYSADRNPVTYFHDLITIASHLRTAGARLVVAEDPVYYMTRDSTLLRTILSLRDSLRSAGVLLHEPRKPSWFWHIMDLQESARDSAVFRVADAATSVLLRPTEDYWQLPGRWYPALDRNASPQMDVGFAAVSRYLGIPDSLPVRLGVSTVRHGPLEIPTDARGMALPLGIVAPDRVDLHVSASRELLSDTLWYSYYKPREFTIDRLLEFPAQGVAGAKGSIVFVIWFTTLDESMPSIQYACAISSALHGKIARQYGSATLWISGLVVVLSVLACMRARLRYAVPAILLLAIGLFGGGVWLLFEHHVLMNMAYPAFAALLSGVIFPLVRLSHEHP